MEEARPRWHEFRPRRLLLPLCLIGAVLLVVTVCGGWGFVRHLTKDPREAEIRLIQAGLNAVEVEMQRQTVIQLMGEPSSDGPEFHLTQREGFEREYDRASRSGSAYYLIWLGVKDDLTYAIGFDTHDIVTMKDVGGS